MMETCSQSCKSGQVRASSKCFGPISGLHIKPFYNVQIVTLFLSWHRFAVLTGVTSVIVTFLQLILYANTAAFFCSQVGLVSHFFWKGDSSEEISTWWRRVEKINHLRDSWPVSRNHGLQNRLFTPVALS